MKGEEREEEKCGGGRNEENEGERKKKGGRGLASREDEGGMEGGKLWMKGRK